MIRRRAIALAASGLVALTAVLLAFAGSASAASPNAIILVTDAPTLDPSATPCIKELAVSSISEISFCSSPSPAATLDPCIKLLAVGPNAPADPTATPVCPTPFQSFQGETATPRGLTPPPTSTTGGSSNGDSAPPIGLFVGLSLGTLGLMAIASRRRPVGE